MMTDQSEHKTVAALERVGVQRVPAGRSMSQHTAVLGLLLACAASVEAQWLAYRDPKTPRTADGRPDLSAPAPRIGGRPDVSGVWRAERTSIEEFTRVLGPETVKLQVDIESVTKHYLSVFWGLKPEEQPMRPEAAAILRQRRPNGQDVPSAYCLPTSLPSTTTLVFKMIQAPGEIVVVTETSDPPRQIYTDGRKLPQKPEPIWTGYSVGAWQGDTLVVETIGITTKAWLDGFGHPRSEESHITERYRRRDFGHMDLEISIEDPKYYTRPFGYKITLSLLPDTDVLEYVCTEGWQNWGR